MRAERNLAKLVVLFGLFTFVHDGAAQYPRVPNVGFFKGERRENEADMNDPSNAQRGAGYLEETLGSPLGNGYGPVWRDPNMFCPADSPNCNENVVVPTPAPIVRNSAVTAFSPMEGFHSTMNSMAYANQAATLLVSPLSVMKVAWALTEPGIGLGTDAAMAQANMWLQNRYLSDQAYVNHLRMGSNGEVLLKTYRDCIAQKMRPTPADPGFVGPLAPRGVSWIQAVSECQGGDAISSTTSEPFSTINDGGFVLSDNTDHPNTAEPNVLSLVDMLFGDVTAGPTAGEMADMRTSFLNLVGNVSLSIGAGFTGARGVQVVRTPPMVAPEKMFRDLTLETYYSLSELMHYNCKYTFHHQYPGGSSFPGGGGWIPGGGNFGDFYKSSIVQNLMERLSVKGYVLGQRAADSLFKIYERQNISIRSPNCDDLKAWEDAKPTSLKSIGGGGAWASKATEMSRIYFAFSKTIAMARYLGSLVQAEGVVYSLSGGDFESTIKRSALSAIYEVAGTSDLQGAYNSNLEYLERLEDKVIRAAKANESDFKNQGAVN